MRLATWIIALLDTAIFLFAASITFLSGSDAATKGLDRVAGLAIVALFLVTAGPALVLTLRLGAPRTALVLALAFPATIVGFVAVIAAGLP